MTRIARTITTRLVVPVLFCALALGVASAARAQSYIAHHGWSKAGASSGSHFGFSVASAGDYNGDNKSDIVIGAPGVSGSLAGKVEVYAGNSGTSTSPIQTVTSASSTALFGWSVASLNVNGDGYRDLLIGAPGENRVYLLRGAAGNTYTQTIIKP